MDTCANIDRTNGPSAGSCRGGFDFTVKFEELFLTVIPSCLFLAATLLRMLFLYKQQVKTKQTSITFLKWVIWKTASILMLTILAAGMLTDYSLDHNCDFSSSPDMSVDTLDYKISLHDEHDNPRSKFDDGRDNCHLWTVSSRAETFGQTKLGSQPLFLT